MRMEHCWCCVVRKTRRRDMVLPNPGRPKRDQTARQPAHIPARSPASSLTKRPQRYEQSQCAHRIQLSEYYRLDTMVQAASRRRFQVWVASHERVVGTGCVRLGAGRTSELVVAQASTSTGRRTWRGTAMQAHLQVWSRYKVSRIGGGARRQKQDEQSDVCSQHDSIGSTVYSTPLSRSRGTSSSHRRLERESGLEVMKATRWGHNDSLDW